MPPFVGMRLTRIKCVKLIRNIYKLLKVEHFEWMEKVSMENPMSPSLLDI
jgi:hypothetical protein